MIEIKAKQHRDLYTDTAEAIARLDMSVEDGVKMIVPAGAYVPAWKESASGIEP